MTIDDLRPIEALSLMSVAGKEKITYLNALTANLVYLVDEEYIERNSSSNTGFRLLKEDNDLRSYERRLIDAIAEDHGLRLIYATILDYREILVQKGFMTVEIKTSGFMSKASSIIQLISEKGYDAIDELVELRNTLSCGVVTGTFAHAFPSLETTYAGEIKQSIEGFYNGQNCFKKRGEFSFDSLTII